MGLVDSGGPDKLLGTYRGVVTHTDDPAGQGRVLALIPQALGTATSNWAIKHSYYDVVPPVGSQVWIHFEGGDPRVPVYSSPIQPPQQPPPPAQSSQAASVAAGTSGSGTGSFANLLGTVLAPTQFSSSSTGKALVAMNMAVSYAGTVTGAQIQVGFEILDATSTVRIPNDGVSILSALLAAPPPTQVSATYPITTNPSWPQPLSVQLQVNLPATVHNADVTFARLRADIIPLA